MPSISTISGLMKARCPHCNRSLDFTEFGGALFQLILRSLDKGERVEIPKFGVFKTTILTARKPKGLVHDIEIEYDKRIIRFRALPSAKQIVNRELRQVKEVPTSAGNKAKFGVVSAKESSQ